MDAWWLRQRSITLELENRRFVKIMRQLDPNLFLIQVTQGAYKHDFLFRADIGKLSFDGSTFRGDDIGLRHDSERVIEAAWVVDELVKVLGHFFIIFFATSSFSPKKG